MEFTPSEQQPVTKCDVVINGKKWGEVFENSRSCGKYHCQLHFVNCFFPGAFGDTMEEAVQNTIHKASEELAEMKADFEAFLAEVQK